VQENQQFSTDHLGKPEMVENGLRISISSVYRTFTFLAVL